MPQHRADFLARQHHPQPLRPARPHHSLDAVQRLFQHVLVQKQHRRQGLVLSGCREIRCLEDLRRFPPFQGECLRGGPVRRWVPKGLAGKPVFVFETGGTTGVPKTRVAMEDFRVDYEMFSETLPERWFPRGANWLMLGPSGPRRYGGCAS